jgi:uncharacterized protein (DUF1810 family)
LLFGVAGSFALSNRFELQRFVDAQAGVYEQACAELRAGRKRSHWMWFVFPQIKGLGSSPTAVRFAISSMEEAHAYLEHPVLGARLRECVGIVLGVSGRSVEEIFGYPDDLKFHSCLTLFARVAELAASAGDASEDRVFDEALAKYFGGVMDQATLERI